MTNRNALFLDFHSSSFDWNFPMRFLALSCCVNLSFNICVFFPSSSQRNNLSFVLKLFYSILFFSVSKKRTISNKSVFKLHTFTLTNSIRISINHCATYIYCYMKCSTSVPSKGYHEDRLLSYDHARN